MNNTKETKIEGNLNSAREPVFKQFKPGTIKRLLSYMKEYRLRLTFVIICIILSAGANAASALFLQSLIDTYIIPLLGQQHPDFSLLLRALLFMGSIYSIGVLATLFYNRMMVVISQGTLKRIRDNMFAHMQSLPIKFFDTHSHGDVMSYYTNDADTLRQMMSQSLPQMFASVVTIATVFFSMLYLSVWLTVFVVLFTLALLKLIKLLVGKSSVHFMKQQESLGDVDGYIEEMINGQKVVKVFCYEEKAKEAFDKKMMSSVRVLLRPTNTGTSLCLL